MRNNDARFRWRASSTLDQAHQPLHVEGRRQPLPFTADALQAAKQEPAGAEMMLDHREWSLARMEAAGVCLLSFGRRHPPGVRDPQLLVLLVIDLPPLRFSPASTAHAADKPHTSYEPSQFASSLPHHRVATSG